MSLAASSPAAAAAAGAWRWWTGELAGMLPHSLRPSDARRPRADIHLAGDGILVDRIADGVGERFAEERRLEDLDEDGWRDLAELVSGHRPRIILSAPDAFCATLTLPPAARRRLQAAVELQIPHVAPIRADQLVWNAEETASDERGVTVLVGMARESRVAELEALFEARELAVPAIAAACGERSVTLTRGGGGPTETERRRLRRAWVAAALLIASIPLTTGGAARFMTSLNEARLAGLEQELAPRMVAERSAAREADVRRALATVLRPGAAVEEIEAIALALPDSDYATGAGRAADGQFRVAVDSKDPEVLQDRLAQSERLARMDVQDIAPSPTQGRLRVVVTRPAR